MPDYHGRMSYGPISIGSLHAPSATIDDSGRYLAIFNVKEGKAEQGWNDVMTLPRLFSLNPDNSLRIEPAPEVESLRTNHRHLGPLDVPANGETVRLRVFVDRSILEVFANGKQCLTLRAYPDREDSAGVSVFARGAAAKLVSLDAWQMRSIWPELQAREGTCSAGG